MCIKKCSVCPKLIAVTSVTEGATNIALDIPVTVFNNRDRICFYIPQTIPNSTLPVVITDGTDTLNLINSCGNAVRAEQLRSRRVYIGYVATDTLNVVVRATLCPTSFVSPQVGV